MHKIDPSQTPSINNPLAMNRRHSVVSLARAEVAAQETPVRLKQSHYDWKVIEQFMNSKSYNPDKAMLVGFVHDLLYHIRSREHVDQHAYSYEPENIGTNAYPVQHHSYSTEHAYGSPAPAHGAPVPSYGAPEPGYGSPAGEPYPPYHSNTPPPYRLNVPSTVQRDRNQGLAPPENFTMSLAFTSSSAASPDGADV